MQDNGPRHAALAAPRRKLHCDRAHSAAAGQPLKPWSQQQKATSMQRKLSAALALVAAGLPGLAAAQTDFATVGKVQCVPDTVTRCSEPGKCTTREASPNDKAQVLVLDFGGKTVSMRRGDQAREVGKVTEDKLEGGVRLIVMTEGEGANVRIARMKLTKEGKLSIEFGGASGGSAAATCTAAAS